MQIGMIGLGRMGASMARRLIKKGHACVVYDSKSEAVAALAIKGANGATSVAELVQQLATPRVIWLMVPAAVVDAALTDLQPHLQAGDIVIDGGNSYYRDDIRRAASLKGAGLHHVDVGTSGGVFGEDRGYCLMVGGEKPIVKHLESIFSALSPGIDSAARTPGRSGEPASSEQGWLHCGPAGAGHFVKMVHNGIEYGLMAAYAEGFDILHKADIGLRAQTADAETSPLREPQFYQYSLDLPEIAELWRRGSVIGSWLLDLSASALSKNPQLEGFDGRVSDSGEGRWTLEAAIDEAVPAPVLSAALYARFTSRGEAKFSNQLLSAMRHAFGGHLEKPEGDHS